MFRKKATSLKTLAKIYRHVCVIFIANALEILLSCTKPSNVMYITCEIDMSLIGWRLSVCVWVGVKGVKWR